VPTRTVSYGAMLVIVVTIWLWGLVLLSSRTEESAAYIFYSFLGFGRLYFILMATVSVVGGVAILLLVDLRKAAYELTLVYLGFSGLEHLVTANMMMYQLSLVGEAKLAHVRESIDALRLSTGHSVSYLLVIIIAISLLIWNRQNLVRQPKE
jgi:hypothetical protein